MRVGIVGKGGVGKTTISALLGQAYVRRGSRVVAVDTDSNPNLGTSLGLTLEEAEHVPVLPRSLAVGSGGDVTAAELLERYGRATPAGPTLLSAMRVTDAGAGCTCGGHATVRSLLGDVLDSEADVALVDMEAGLEHLSRAGGTLAYADVLLVVVEPTRKSVLTAARTAALASELGIPRTLALGNKARLPDDEEFFARELGRHDIALAGIVPFADEVAEVDREGGAVVTAPPPAVVAAIDDVLDRVGAQAT